MISSLIDTIAHHQAGQTRGRYVGAVAGCNGVEQGVFVGPFAEVEAIGISPRGRCRQCRACRSRWRRVRRTHRCSACPQ